MVDGRRVFSTGYNQVATLRDLPGGIVLPLRFCAAALAGKIGRFDPEKPQESIDRVASELAEDQLFDENGYGCTSVDTMNGGSGGPVLAVSDDSTDLVLIGVIIGAAHTSPSVECQAVEEPIIQDVCTGRDEVERMDWYNLFERVPAEYMESLR